MTTISIANRNDGSLGNGFEDRGKWWFPDSPEEILSGVVSFSVEGGGGSLKLTGGFLDPETHYYRQIENVVMFGDTIDHGRVTIIDASYGGPKTRGGNKREDILEEAWMFSSMLIGDHLRDPNQILFQQVIMATQALPEWAASQPNVDSVGDQKPEMMKIEVNIPDSLTAEVNSNKIGMRWADSWSYGRTRATVTVTPKFTFDSITGSTLEDIWESFVTPLLFLTSFATGEPDRLAEIEVVRFVQPASGREAEIFGEKKPERYRVVSTQWAGVMPDGNHRWWEVQLPFKNFEDHFPSIVPAWFKLYRQARATLLEFFAITLYPNMFLEDSFARSVRSLEMWHRSMFNGSIMEEAEYHGLLAKLKDVCTRTEWDLVSMRMKYGNEFTQKMRIDKLIEDAGRHATDLIAHYRTITGRAFSRAVVNMRNQMTHGPGPDESPVMSNREMYWASRMLQFIFHCNLLQQLGFEDQEIDRLIQSSSIYRTLHNNMDAWFSN